MNELECYDKLLKMWYCIYKNIDDQNILNYDYHKFEIDKFKKAYLELNHFNHKQAIENLEYALLLLL